MSLYSKLIFNSGYVCLCLQVSRDLTTGEILEFYEVENLSETIKGTPNRLQKQSSNSVVDAKTEQQSALLRNTQIDINFEKGDLKHF